MREAKLRAERRREAREAAAPVDTRKKFTYLSDPIPAEVREQIDLRYAFMAGTFETRGEFIAALLQAGMDECDRDVHAVEKYRRGEAKPVSPEPKEERLVLSPNEVPEEAKRVLAAVSPAGYVGRRTMQ